MNKEKTRKNSDISERISEMIEFLGESRNSFALKLGYERAQTIYDIVNCKSAPSYDFFRRFQLSEFSESININWLLTGRGNMEKSAPPMNTAIEPLPIYKKDEESLLYKMYKEKDAEVKALSEQIGALKQEISNLTDEITLMRISSQHSSSAEFARDVNAQRK